MILIFTILLLSLSIIKVENARILGIFLLPAKSHTELGKVLFSELAARGHEVTLVSPHPMENPPDNFRNINLTSRALHKVNDDITSQAFQAAKQDPFILLYHFFLYFYYTFLLTKHTLFDPAIQELLHSKTEKFDLIIIDSLQNPAVFGFGKHFNAPTIGVFCFGQYSNMNDMLHNPTPLSVIPNPFLGLGDRMNFIDRMINVFSNGFMKHAAYYLWYYPTQAYIYESAFPKRNKPTFNEVLESDMSLALIHNHFSISSSQAMLPNMIQIAGIHLKESLKPLPIDILQFIESAEHGVVYFSFGSITRLELMDVRKLEHILAAFTNMNQKVIMKCENGTIIKYNEEKILIRDWFLQDEILAHINVKVFVTHGGMNSLIETVRRKVPFVGIPLFADQFLNIKQAELLGIGLNLPYQNLTEESLSWAIQEVIQNERYSYNMREVARQFKDRPNTPKENAIFWIEYVIRHKGAYHLQSSAKFLNPIQYHNIDVYFTFFTILIIVSYVVKKLYKRYFKKPSLKILKKFDKTIKKTM